MISIDPWCYYVAALLIMTVPVSWLLSVLTAAVIHEVFHILTVIATGGRIDGIHLRPMGAVIESQTSGQMAELLAILAGPAGSFLTVGCYRLFPKLAVCALVQGIFNLLPVYPLDGGRLLKCLGEVLWPEMVDRVGIWTEMTVIAVLLLLSKHYVCGYLPVMMVGCLVGRRFLRKIPCKGGENRVQ